MDCTATPTAPQAPGVLTPAEKETLQTLERTVDAGLKTFYDVGNALATIRDGKLYREAYTSFEDYLGARWGISRPRAYQLIAAAGVQDDLSTVVDTHLPNERQARELARLPEDDRADCWADYSEDCEEAGVKPTAAGLREKVNLYLADNEPFEPNCDDDEPVAPDSLIEAHAQPWDRWGDWRVAVANAIKCCKQVDPGVVAAALEGLAADIRAAK